MQEEQQPSQDGKNIFTIQIWSCIYTKVNPEAIRYFTKGDANSVPDGTSVHYKNIIGKPVFSIPYLGYVSNYVQTPPGMYVAIAAAAILIMLVFLPDVFGSDEKRKKEEDSA